MGEEQRWGINHMSRGSAVRRRKFGRAKKRKLTRCPFGGLIVFVVLACLSVAGGWSESQAQPMADLKTFDIHRDGGQLHLSSAYQLPAGAVSVRAAVLHPRTGLSRLDENLTFGRVGAAWGVTDRIQLSAGGNFHVHGPGTITNKFFGRTTLMSYSLGGKFLMVDQTRLKIGFAGTLDRLKWIERQAKKIIGVKFVPAGSAHVPITWAATPVLDLHVAPGISVMPSYIDSKIGAGTIAHANLGFTYVPTSLFSLYGSYNLPVSETMPSP